MPAAKQRGYEGTALFPALLNLSLFVASSLANTEAHQVVDIPFLLSWGRRKKNRVQVLQLWLGKNSPLCVLSPSFKNPAYHVGYITWYITWHACGVYNVVYTMVYHVAGHISWYTMFWLITPHFTTPRGTRRNANMVETSTTLCTTQYTALG